MFEIKNVRQVVFLVVVSGQVALLERTIRRRALARVMNPSYQVIVIRLFTHASQVGAEPPAHSARALAHGVTAHAAPRLKTLLALGRIAGSLRRCFCVQRTLQDEGGDRAHLIVGQPEARHPCSGTEGVGVLDPDRNPFRSQLGAHLFQVGSDFLAVHLQEPDLSVELVRLQVDVADGQAQVVGLGIILARRFVIGSVVAGLDVLVDIQQELSALYTKLLDAALGRYEVLRLGIVSLETVAAHAATPFK